MLPIKKQTIRLLHVDDDSSLLEVFAEIIKNEGDFEVDSTLSVAEAFEKLTLGTYDVIVSDYEMPQKDGLTFLKDLKTLKFDVPFILFTGKGREEVAIEALNLGAYGYINKQGNPATVYGELAHTIRKALQHYTTESILKQNEAYYRSLYENSFDAIIITDSKGNIESVNQAACRLFGSSEEIIKKYPSSYWISDKAAERKLREAFNNSKSNVELICRRADGTPFTAEVTSSQFFDSQGKNKVSTFIRDITERKLAEEKIHSSEERYRMIADNMQDVISVIDEEGVFSYVSPSIKNFFGESKGFIPEELLGKNGFGFIHPDDVEKIISPNLPRILGGEEIPALQLRSKNKTGGYSWVESYVKAVKDPAGHLKLLTVSRNIAERKKAQENLEAIYRTMPIPTYTWKERNGDFQLIDFNDAALKITNGFVQDFLGVLASKHYADNPQILADIASCYKDKKAFERKMYYTFQTERTRKYLNVKYIFVQPDSVLVYTDDLTDQKKVQDELVESEVRYRTLFEQAGDYILVLEVEPGKVPIIYDANENALKTHGYSREEIIGKPITFLDTTANIAEILNRVDRLLKDETISFEAKHQRKDGERIVVDIVNKHVKVGNKDFLLSIERDVTERKKAEEELKLSSTMLDLASDQITVIDTEGRLVFFNKATCDAYGYSKEELSKMTMFQLNAPETAKLVKPRIKILLAKGSASFEALHLRKDGTKTPVEVNAKVISIGGAKLILSVVRNIADRKAIELELKASRAKVAAVNEKLRIVSSLTRHDVGNKLAGARANLFLVKKKTNDAKLIKYVVATEEALSQADKILAFSKLYEKIGSEKPSEISVVDAFDEAAKLIPHDGINIHYNCIGLVLVADSLLRQLFYNLIDNSLKHGKTLDKIWVDCQQTDKEIRLIYHDNGVGVPEENKKMIFADGFSTGGTGLGLKLVKKIIEGYGWTITENGEPGKGARFEITIPKRT